MDRPRGRRFFVETWGCQMNELDSQRMAGQLMAQGLLPTREVGEADLILLNSCSVREKAVNKVYSRLGEYRLLKLENPELRIGLCGCVAQQEGEAALARVRELDFVLGPARVGELGEIWPSVARGERLVRTGFPAERDFDVEQVARDGEFKGMVTAIEGCDKRCTFCIVPSTRGPERCRPLAQIVAEVRHLLDYGFVEVELLGQTINHWRQPGGDADFADLLDAVAPLPGLARLRFVTSYPRDFTPRMVAAFARHANLADYLHLPVQSGSDAVLRRMGRGYTVGEYLTLVESVRAARPTVAVSTDLIVGFPGETEDDFLRTLDLLGAARFSAVYAFCYSPRPGTPATRMDGVVPRQIAEERLQRLLEQQAGVQSEAHRGMIGRELDLLVTGPGRVPGTLSGRTSCNRIVHFEAPAGSATEIAPRLGEMRRVQIVRAMPNSLQGELRGAPGDPGRRTSAADGQADGASRRSRLTVVA